MASSKRQPSLGSAITFRHSFSLSFLALFLLLFVSTSLAQQDTSCSTVKQCKSGCCSSQGQCGFGPDFCGDGCQGTCDAKAECGQYAPAGKGDCPINVCCSKWGFCGTTDDFCGDGCQKNSGGAGCGPAPSPGSCPTMDALSLERRIGYYELFNLDKSCNVFEPEEIIVAGLTHLNLAFVNFGSDYKLNTGDGDAIYRASLLKINNNGLKVCISVGGWTFNDPPTSTYWSDMASTHDNRATFINSVTDFLKKYALDGVDLDWEYPSADDRGGIPADATNYVDLVSELRDAFDAINPAWTITVTLPTSYWYLRGFAIESMQKYVSWFNLMSYDLHGMWDQTNIWTGPYLEGHTDVQEIDQGLQLLWRNNIDPKNVVFGMAFYGRSFTMADPNCYQPNGICQFSTGGRAGDCSATPGILTYQEVMARQTGSLDTHIFYNATSTVKFMVFDGDQWVSYDDDQSFKDKLKFVSSRCLSGVMVWALDQDDSNFDAYEGLFGDTSLLQLEGGGLSPEQQQQLADQFAAYTGQNCFVTPTCTDGSQKESGPDQVCPGGTTSVSTAHTPLQSPGHAYHGDCSVGWYRHICCPTNAMPQNCKWNGAPVRSEFGCSGSCSSSQFELATDTALDDKGEGSCYTGTRSLCCDSTGLIEDCYWSPCQGPLAPGTPPQCNAGYTFEEFRLDNPDGTRWCSDQYVDAVTGQQTGSPLHDRFKSALCCPDKTAFKNCAWSNNEPGPSGIFTIDPDLYCKPQQCPKGKIEIAKALDPSPSPEIDVPDGSGVSCDGYQIPAGTDMQFPLCCDLQSKYNSKWPVDPKELFSIYYDTPGDADVLWQYSDEQDNLVQTNDPSGAGSDDDGGEDGKSAFGFMMLDGPEGSIDTGFSTTNTVVRRQAEIPNIKRSLVTTNKTLIDSVFDHSEEIFRVYCNYPHGSKQCNRIFIDGAEDTIISLPDHIGEGPFARIVSMQVVENGHKDLPTHHLQHRSTQNIHENPVYEVKIDYNFMAITPKRADQPIMLRVDYTNLLGYWDEVDTADPSKAKRSAEGKDDMVESNWHSKVRRAIIRDSAVRKREAPINITAPMHLETRDVDLGNGQFEKRWWGVIGGWIKKLTTITKSDTGIIPLAWAGTKNLFNAQWGCPGNTFSANLKMDLEAQIQMDATYAYYLSGTFIPPSKPDVYAYLGMEPSAYVGLKMTGNAIMQYTSGQKKIVDTLAYPGLAVKGIAAVGPTLDVYGEIRGKVTLHGEMVAGATINFGKAEVYWPTDDATSQQYQKLLGLDAQTDVPPQDTLAPTFDAGVAVDAQIDVIITPQANVGVKIGGGSLVGGVTIMDAQLSGYVTGDLSFQASASSSLSSGVISYSYGVYAFYNLGYKVTAIIAGLVNWGTGPIQAYSPDKRIDIYGPKTGTISLTKRTDDGLWLDYEDPHGISWNTSSEVSALVRRQTSGTDGDGTTSPNTPEFSQNLQCPPGSNADIKIPELRFNCDAFGDTQVINAAGLTYLASGMCTGWRSAPNRPVQLTHSADDTRNGERRTASCGTSYCGSVNVQLTAFMAPATAPKLSCDEAPWASTEEGGDYEPSNARSTTCVPTYQNSAWGGNCQKMVGNMQTNWGKIDSTVAVADRTDDWRGWNDNAWVTNTLPQRAAVYPNDMPPPDGLTQATPQTSWFFRRNYTWSIVDNSNQASSWWDATAKQFVSTSYNALAGWQGVICAMNTFGTDYFRMQTFNGYCMRVETYTSSGWQNVHRSARCTVTFGVNSKKRGLDDEEKEDDWVIEGIQYEDTPEEEEMWYEVVDNGGSKASFIPRPDLSRADVFLDDEVERLDVLTTSSAAATKVNTPSKLRSSSIPELGNEESSTSAATLALDTPLSVVESVAQEIEVGNAIDEDAGSRVGDISGVVELVKEKL